jgi:hypothetical protein
VHSDLAVELMAQQSPLTVINSGGGFITGSFNAKYFHSQVRDQD